MNDSRRCEFTNKTHGGRSISVFRMWTFLTGPDNESWQEWGPLGRNHLRHRESKRKIEKDEDDELVVL